MKNQFNDFEEMKLEQPVIHKKSNSSSRWQSYNESAIKEKKMNAFLQISENQVVNSFMIPNSLKLDQRISEKVRICKTKEENLLVVSILQKEGMNLLIIPWVNDT